MFLRKLSAIGYSGAPQFSINDEVSVRSLVVWLEDTIFFTDLPDLLNQLRDENHPEWNGLFQGYLSKCECPFNAATERTSCVDWLLREAIRLVAEDPDSRLDSIDTSKIQASSGKQNDFANINVESKEFRDGVEKMAVKLGIPVHPNSQVTLQAIASLLAERLGKDVQHYKENIPHDGKVGLPFEKVTLGFDTHDKTLNDACKVMRLLHVRKLRKLQTQIDIAMVAAQSVTANPKTDEKLGRTGF